MKKMSLKTFLAGLAAVLVFWVGLVIFLAFLGGEKNAEDPFKNCQTLVDSCKDKSCNYLFLCNETEFSDCHVYDCGEKYGVKILDKQGKIQNKFRQKADQAKIQKIVSKCRGSFEIIEKNNCENSRAKAKVKLDTQGDCKITGATMDIGGKTRIANIEQDGEFYNISVKSCGEISDIKITGEGGIAINKKIEIPKDALPEDMNNIMREEMPSEGPENPKM